MAAPRDPFRPGSDDGDAPLELARPTGKPARSPVDAQPTVELPAPREPLKYKKPGGGWVTLLVLLLALGGAVTGLVVLLKKVTPTDTAAPAPAPKPVTYRALETGDAVLITVEVKPRGTRLFIDGEPMASNPVRLPRGTTPKTISGQADGHESASVQVVPDAAKTVRLELPRGTKPGR